MDLKAKTKLIDCYYILKPRFNVKPWFYLNFELINQILLLDKTMVLFEGQTHQQGKNHFNVIKLWFFLQVKTINKTMVLFSRMLVNVPVCFEEL